MPAPSTSTSLPPLSVCSSARRARWLEVAAPPFRRPPSLPDELGGLTWKKVSSAATTPAAASATPISVPSPPPHYLPHCPCPLSPSSPPPSCHSPTARCSAPVVGMACVGAWAREPESHVGLFVLLGKHQG
jgi:hypothetical protein